MQDGISSVRAQGGQHGGGRLKHPLSFKERDRVRMGLGLASAATSHRPQPLCIQPAERRVGTPCPRGTRCNIRWAEAAHPTRCSGRTACTRHAQASPLLQGEGQGEDGFRHRLRPAEGQSPLSPLRKGGDAWGASSTRAESIASARQTRPLSFKERDRVRMGLGIDCDRLKANPPCPPFAKGHPVIAGKNVGWGEQLYREPQRL
jgi:hypothetical protein